MKNCILVLLFLGAVSCSSMNTNSVLPETVAFVGDIRIVVDTSEKLGYMSKTGEFTTIQTSPEELIIALNKALDWEEQSKGKDVTFGKTIETYGLGNFVLSYGKNLKPQESVFCISFADQRYRYFSSLYISCTNITEVPSLIKKLSKQNISNLIAKMKESSSAVNNLK